MNNSDPRAETERSTEIAGEATVESAPAERDSSDGEEGLTDNIQNSVQLPDPVHQIDIAPGSDSVSESSS